MVVLHLNDNGGVKPLGICVVSTVASIAITGHVVCATTMAVGSCALTARQVMAPSPQPPVLAYEICVARSDRTVLVFWAH